MTYTYNDQAIFQAVAGAKAIIRRPTGMFDFRWKTYAAGVVDALNSKGSTSSLELGEAIHKAMLGDAQESPSMKLVDILARELKVWPERWVVCSQDSDSYIAGYSDASLMRFSNGVWVGMDNFISGDWVLSKHDRGLSSDYPTAIVTRAEWQAAVDAIYADEPADPAKLNSRATHDERKKNADLRLSAMIEMGWLQPVFTAWPEVPEYDFSLWPRERFDCGLLPSVYLQSFGRGKRHQPVEVKSQPGQWDGEGLPPVGVDCEVLDDMKAGGYAPVRVIIHDEGRAVFRYTGGANKGDHDSAGHGSQIHQLPIFRPIRTAEQIADDEHARRKREDAIELMVEVSPLLDKGWSRKVCAALYDAGCSLPVNTGK